MLKDRNDWVKSVMVRPRLPVLLVLTAGGVGFGLYVSDHGATGPSELPTCMSSFAEHEARRLFVEAGPDEDDGLRIVRFGNVRSTSADATEIMCQAQVVLSDGTTRDAFYGFKAAPDHRFSETFGLLDATLVRPR